MEYHLIRSRRRTLAIAVDREGRLEVRAPLRLPLSEVEAFLLKKRDWIGEKQTLSREKARLREAFRVEIGGEAMLLGVPCPILSGSKADFSDGAFRVKPSSPCKPQLIAVYRGLAKERLRSRVEQLAPAVGVSPASVKITSAMTRFGSCSGKNGLCFTWRLMLAEAELIDYVVVHELCHIKQHNHSSRFWAEVERVLPDYQSREARLRVFGRSLQEQNWED